jgi:CBS domain-containing protein
MSEHNIGALLVVDENDKLVGMFTERDVLHCTARGVDLDSEPVENVMSKELITFSPDDDIAVAVQVIADKKKRHLPIVEGDKVVGLVNYRDVVSYLLPEVFYLSEALY